MGIFQRTSALLIVAGLVGAALTPNTLADDGGRRYLRATDVDQVTDGTFTPVVSPQAALFPYDCLPPPDQYPPCANPPCDLLEMLSQWCASNVEDLATNPEGIICATSDLRTDPDFGYTVADSFVFGAETEVQGVTWWGLIIEFGDLGATNCDDTMAPPAADNWTIRYWENTTSPVEDLPLPDELLLIKEFTGVNTSLDGEPGEGTFTRQRIRYYGSFWLYEMTYTFDPADRFVDTGRDPIWLEITNTSDYAGNECVFCWEVASPDWDLYSLQKLDRADPYDPELNDGEQVNPWDQAQCQDVCFNEARPNPPSVELELRDSAPVDENECCWFRYTIVNENSPGAGSVTKFYMAVHRGDHKKPDCGEDLSEIRPPPGWTVSYCEGWRTRQLGSSDWVIYQFDPVGGEIPELGEVYGSLRVRVNDNIQNALDDDDTVPPFGIRAWGSQHEYGDQFCGSGSNFDPLLPNIGPAGEEIWSDATNGTCTGEDGDPLRSIPSGTALGKGLLAILFIGAGVWLVVRSRRPATI